MHLEIVTPTHLQEFREQLLKDIKEIVSPKVERQKKWIKAIEVRKLLKISPGTLQVLRENGTLRFSKIGGILFYDYEHMLKMIQDNVREARDTEPPLGSRKKKRS